MTFFLEVMAGALAVAVGICAPSVARWIRSRAAINEANAADKLQRQERR